MDHHASYLRHARTSARPWPSTTSPSSFRLSLALAFVTRRHGRRNRGQSHPHIQRPLPQSDIPTAYLQQLPAAPLQLPRLRSIRPAPLPPSTSQKASDPRVRLRRRCATPGLGGGANRDGGIHGIRVGGGLRLEHREVRVGVGRPHFARFFCLFEMVSVD